VDRDQSLFDMQTMTARVSASFWQHRVATAVLGVFAFVAWTLAAIGTYAVTAQAVASQRREIGIRLALGSSRADVGWLVMRRWLTPIALGIIAGLAGGAVLARMLADALGVTGLSGISLMALAGAPAALALAAVAACYVPVRQVMMRVQLVDALRAE
jgi:putative ABC transport system permease protein